MATNVSAPSFKVTGNRVGDTYTADKGQWTVPDGYYLTYEFQWLRCDQNGNNCMEIPGAKNDTYVLTSADVGHRLRLRTSAIEHQNAPVPPDPTPDPPPSGFGTALRSRFPAIVPTTIVDDTGKPDRTSAVVYDGSGYHDILLTKITRRGGSGDGFKFAGGAQRIEVRLCNAYNPGASDDKPQLLNFQRGPKQIQVYGGEYAGVGSTTLSHFAYMGADSTDILQAGCLARDMYGYGLQGYPGPGSGVAANCTIIHSQSRNFAVVYPGFNMYIVNSILAYNALSGIKDGGGTWKVENCCVWPRPSNYTDSRFVNCIFEDPQLDSQYKPTNPNLFDAGLAAWMAPFDYKGNGYTQKTLGAVAV